MKIAPITDRCMVVIQKVVKVVHSYLTEVATTDTVVEEVVAIITAMRKTIALARKMIQITRRHQRRIKTMKRTQTAPGGAIGVVRLTTTQMIVISVELATNAVNKGIRHLCANQNRRRQLL